MVFFVKSVKHTFYTLHTIIPDFGDVRKLTGYSPFTQYLQTQYNNLRLISSGDGTRGGLNLKLVGGYVVSMPCFIEQQKIVACLSALDDVIEKKKATLAAWEELKKGLLQQMFV